ncbi:hypothetical protein VPH35_029647 [Triticum aestivum]
MLPPYSCCPFLSSLLLHVVTASGVPRKGRAVAGPNSFVFPSRASVDLGGNSCVPFALSLLGLLSMGTTAARSVLASHRENFRFSRGLGSRRGFPFLECLRFSIRGLLTSELRWDGMGGSEPCIPG